MELGRGQSLSSFRKLESYFSSCTHTFLELIKVCPLPISLYAFFEAIYFQREYSAWASWAEMQCVKVNGPFWALIMPFPYCIVWWIEEMRIIIINVWLFNTKQEYRLQFWTSLESVIAKQEILIQLQISRYYYIAQQTVHHSRAN